MRLYIYKAAAVRVPRRRLQQLFDRITSSERGGKGGVNIIFTGDRELHRLNKQYRRIDKTTDVLSFNLDDEAGEGEVFGEIYISVATAERQAREYGTGLADELLRLSCHGLLHLFGYDHHRRDEAAEMRRREEKYLAVAEGR